MWLTVRDFTITFFLSFIMLLFISFSPLIFISGSSSNSGEYPNVTLVKVPIDADALARDGVRHPGAADAGAEDLPDLEGVLHSHS